MTGPRSVSELRGQPGRRDNPVGLGNQFGQHTKAIERVVLRTKSDRKAQTEFGCDIAGLAQIF